MLYKPQNLRNKVNKKMEGVLMFKEEIMEKLYSCRICQNTCLKSVVCSSIPEPLIGNWRASFAIVGVNPGPISLDFENLREYIDFYSNPQKCGLDLKERWQRGYFEVYKKLVNLKSTLDDFNRHAVILNTIKCSTTGLKKIPEGALEKAKANCIHYLTAQFEVIQPKVILAHGKFTCCTIVDMLRNETKYAVVSTSRDIDTLAKDIYTRPHCIDEISKEYVTAKNGNGRKTLFLFNKHLSIYGPAIKSLSKNMEEKRRIIRDFLY